MKRARVVSAAWTALVVVLATLALVGITRFMATIHDSLTADRRGSAEAGASSDTAPSPPDTGEVPRGAAPSADTGASVGPSRPRPSAPAGTVPAPTDVERTTQVLRTRDLVVPVQGVPAASLTPSFTSPRGGGSRAHEALDIMAPTGTPVVAVEDGKVAKLFTSEAGGLTIYQFDPSSTVAYYYAHLDRYAPGLTEGATLRRGQVIGFVGSSGNADPNAPHLHFAIFRLGPEKKWWEGDAVDPYPVLRR